MPAITPLPSLESACLKALLAHLSVETELTWGTGRALPGLGQIEGVVSFFSESQPSTLAQDFSEAIIYIGLDAYGQQSLEFQCLILDWLAKVADVLALAGARGIPGEYQGVEGVPLCKGLTPAGSPYRQQEIQVEPQAMEGSTVLATYRARLVYSLPIRRERYSLL